MLMGEAGGGTPAVVFRGLEYPHSGDTLFRDLEKDIIRQRLRMAANDTREEKILPSAEYP
jgi:F420-0:gamma-glutamyl ligase